MMCVTDVRPRAEYKLNPKDVGVSCDEDLRPRYFLPPQKDIQMRDEFLGRNSGESKGKSRRRKSKRWRESAAFYVYEYLLLAWLALLCSALLCFALALHHHFTPHTAPRLGRLPWLMLSSIIKIRYRILSSSS